MNPFRAIDRVIAASVGPFLFVAACILQSPSVHATGSTMDLESYLAGATSILPDRRKAWNFNLGIGVGSVPEYIGGKDYEPVILPLIDIAGGAAPLQAPSAGLGLASFGPTEVFVWEHA